MSDSDAIGGVSATLKSVLEDRMDIPDGVTDLRVTIGLPRSDQPEDAGVEQARVNVFLYRVTRSPALANQQIPGRGVPGAYGHPPLSLDLHYLITGYGTIAIDDDFVDETPAHFLLGSAMRVLHDHALLSQELRSLRAPLDRPLLHRSLRGEFESVKVTLDPLTLDDISKVWTAITLPYRASAAYTATVVQIESRRVPRSPRLVGELPDGGPRVAAVTAPWPRLERVAVRRPGDEPGTERAHAYVRIGDTVVLHGHGLGDGLRVTFGETDVSAAVTHTGSDRIEVTVPDVPALAPGPQAVRVRRALPGIAGQASNVVAFLLVPAVATAAVAGLPPIMTLTGSRLFDPELDCFALVGDRMVSSEEFDPRQPASITFPAPEVLPAGEYPVRVRVNDAESIDERMVQLP